MCDKTALSRGRLTNHDKLSFFRVHDISSKPILNEILRNLDSFRRTLDEISYSTKRLLHELRLGEMSLDEMSFRRNAFRRNVMDPIIPSESVLFFTVIISIYSTMIYFLSILFKHHYFALFFSFSVTKMYKIM